ncbi:erythromycin esterase family protein [Agreia bicolorata]|uniref:erythromycin esterase family protein n=1 Tax=Agreia bicolorata TaxID=110935 RepID=UPI000A04BC27|nr:erythromycin esterase family protein [Agreia bicolorata]
MSNHPHTPAPAPSFTTATWDERHPLANAELSELLSGARVIGVGESAHFVAELNAARASLVEALIQRGVNSLALEIGHDGAHLVEQWLSGERPEELRTLVGPLTTALYGTFLDDLRNRLPQGHGIHVLGVDLPNSLAIEPSLAPLASILATVDPAATELVQATRQLAAGVVGGSAAASATSWLALDRPAQDALTVHLTRLRARVDALSAVHAIGANAHLWREANALIDAAATTDVMVRAMADLFSSTGRIDDTTIREVFVARRISEAVETLAAGDRIAYVAHNNHIQKTPVVFDGVLTAYSAGSMLADSLGSGYRAIALTHTDDQVPEMSFPAATDIGFRVERADSAPIGEDSVEAACANVLQSADASVVRWEATGEAETIRIRSQSATAEVGAGAFDAAIVFASATTDAAVRVLGLD